MNSLKLLLDMIFITAIKKLRQKAESLPPIHTQITTQRKGKVQMLPLLQKASTATKFNRLCISPVPCAMPVMLTIISKSCWAVPWHPWHPLPFHTQLVNCSRDLHPTRPQREHNQHPSPVYCTRCSSFEEEITDQKHLGLSVYCSVIFH